MKQEVLAMPIVPPNVSGYSGSPMGAKPSQANLLMAAAEMHSRGQLAEPKRSIPQQGVERPKVPGRKVRKLKVVK